MILHFHSSWFGNEHCAHKASLIGLILQWYSYVTHMYCQVILTITLSLSLIYLPCSCHQCGIPTQRLLVLFTDCLCNCFVCIPVVGKGQLVDIGAVPNKIHISVKWCTEGICVLCSCVPCWASAISTIILCVVKIFVYFVIGVVLLCINIQLNAK